MSSKTDERVYQHGIRPYQTGLSADPGNKEERVAANVGFDIPSDDSKTVSNSGQGVAKTNTMSYSSKQERSKYVENTASLRKNVSNKEQWKYNNCKTSNSPRQERRKYDNTPTLGKNVSNSGQGMARTGKMTYSPKQERRKYDDNTAGFGKNVSNSGQGMARTGKMTYSPKQERRKYDDNTAGFGKNDLNRGRGMTNRDKMKELYKRPKAQRKADNNIADNASRVTDFFLSYILPYYKLLMQILETNKEMKKTMTGIKTQMALGAGGTLVGGLVGGPAGALVGSIVGSVLGYLLVDDYNSMITVIKNLTDADKTQLVKKVQELIGNASLEALTSYIELPGQRKLLLQCIQSVVQK